MSARRERMPPLNWRRVSAFAAAVLAAAISDGFDGNAASFRFTQIDMPGAAATSAEGVNDAGQIVGTLTDRGGLRHGFLYSGGSFTQIDAPGAWQTFLQGINNAGQIVGFTLEAYYSFLYSGGRFTRIEAPGNFFFPQWPRTSTIRGRSSVLT